MDKLTQPLYKVVGLPLTLGMKRQLVLLNAGVYPSNPNIFLGYPDDLSSCSVTSAFANFTQLLGEDIPLWAKHANSMMLFRWKSNPEWLAFHLSFFS